MLDMGGKVVSVKPDIQNLNKLTKIPTLPMEKQRFLRRHLKQKDFLGDGNTYTGLVRLVNRRNGGMGDHEDLERLMDEMKEGDIVPARSTYKFLLSGFARAGQKDKIVSILKEMQKDNILEDTQTLNSVLECAFFPHHKSDSSSSTDPDLELLNLAEQIRQRSKVAMDRNSFHHLLTYFARRMDLGKIQDLVRTMEKREVHAIQKSYEEILVCLSKLGPKASNAHALLRQEINEAFDITDESASAGDD